MSIYKKLHYIQKNLNAQKTQYNSFGKYKYRNVEDILSGVKDVLPDDCAVVMTDDILMIGDRFYVKATATLKCADCEISSQAYARESFDKKGMDSAQVTGAASSYARKYALCALFAIDDSKTEPAESYHSHDPDDDAGQQPTTPKKPYAKIGASSRAATPKHDLDDIPFLADDLKSIKMAFDSATSKDELRSKLNSYLSAYQDPQIKKTITTMATEIANSKFKEAKHDNGSRE